MKLLREYCIDKYTDGCEVIHVFNEDGSVDEIIVNRADIDVESPKIDPAKSNKNHHLFIESEKAGDDL